MIRSESKRSPIAMLECNITTSFVADKTANQRALEWAQQQIPFYGVSNLTTDWTDGVALCTLVEAVRPGSCPSCELLKPEKNLRNCVLGLVLMRKHLGITKVWMRTRLTLVVLTYSLGVVIESTGILTAKSWIRSKILHNYTEVNVYVIVIW